MKSRNILIRIAALMCAAMVVLAGCGGDSDTPSGLGYISGNVQSAPFYYAMGDNELTVTLTGGTFTASPSISNFDQSSLTSTFTSWFNGTVTRLSDTVVKITDIGIAMAGNSGSGSTLTVRGNAMATQATGVTVAASSSITLGGDDDLVGEWTSDTGNVYGFLADGRLSRGTGYNSLYSAASGIITIYGMSADSITVNYSINGETLTLSNASSDAASINGTYTKDSGSGSESIPDEATEWNHDQWAAWFAEHNTGLELQERASVVSNFRQSHAVWTYAHEGLNSKLGHWHMTGEWPEVVGTKPEPIGDDATKEQYIAKLDEVAAFCDSNPWYDTTKTLVNGFKLTANVINWAQDKGASITSLNNAIASLE